jgi:hypothetical protein
MPSTPRAAAAEDTSDSTGMSQTSSERMRPEAGPPVDSQTTRNLDMPADATRTPAPSVRNPGTADQTKDADNTKVNRRDSTDALTPMDQGNSTRETQITAAVRKGIMSQDLSFTAKNVKVITIGTRVTLRGPVKTLQERSAIEAVAQNTRGVQSVDNQLEVKQ